MIPAKVIGLVAATLATAVIMVTSVGADVSLAGDPQKRRVKTKTTAPNSGTIINKPAVTPNNVQWQ